MRRVALALALICVLCRPAIAGPLSCSETATSGLIFTNAYNVYALTTYSVTATVGVTCNKNNVPYTISANAGMHSVALPNRDLKYVSGADVLPYFLYTTAAHTTVFGDGTNGTAIINANNPSSGTQYTTSIYGTLAAGADVTAGSYTDTVTLTVTY